MSSEKGDAVKPAAAAAPSASEPAPEPAPEAAADAVPTKRWGGVRSVRDSFAMVEVDEYNPEALRDGVGKLKQELEKNENVRLSVRGGGTRDLTIREQLLLRSLQKRPEHRSEEDVTLVARATADIKFFQRLTQKQHMEICREMQHEVVSGNTTLFTQGDEVRAQHPLAPRRRALLSACARALAPPTPHPLAVPTPRGVHGRSARRAPPFSSSTVAAASS
jgi:hypothetical protein